MPDQALKRRFEQALSARAYTAAWRFSCRLALSREDAEDLLQDALAQAYARFAQLRQPERFLSWLLSIVRRCHLMRLRQAGRRPRTTSPYADIAPQAPVDAFQANVLDALDSLAEPQRALLVLVYMEGLSHDEAADALGIKPTAVRMRLSRARRALRERVERQQAKPRIERAGQQTGSPSGGK